MARVLIVEDERIVALHLRQQLVRFGYDLTAVAASGDQALRNIAELPPDIVLMDVHIDGPIDGIETAARIPECLQIPVIYLTAHSETPTLDRARSTKPYGYLLKPFAERELHATIQMALERRAVEVALRESERRLRLAHEQLEQLVAERSADLVRANDVVRLAYEQILQHSLELSATAQQMALTRAAAEAVNNSNFSPA